MVDFPMAVNPPQGVSYAAPLIDFSPLSQLGDRFFQGAKSRSDYDQRQKLLGAFPNGLPTTPDGQIDYGAATQALAKLGLVGQVPEFAQLAASSPQGQAAAARAKATVEQEFLPKTVDIKRPGPFGDTVTETMMRGPAGFTPIPPTPGAPGAPGGGGSAAGGVPVDQNGDPLTGDAYLKSLPGPLQSIVKKVANYEISPTSLSIRGGHRERIMSAASQYDPDYDAALAPARFAAIKEFNSGGLNAPAGVITSGNTAIQHLKTLSDVSQKIGGASNWGPLNSILNKGNVAYKGQENDPDLVEYNNALGRFAEEATKFYRGIGGTDADIKQALDLVKAAQSPEARNRAIATQAELMQSKINALQDRWRQATGAGGWKKVTAAGDFPIVAQKSQDAMGEIMKRAGHAAPGPAPAEPGGRPAASASAPAPQAAGSRPQGISDDQILSEAKAAIAAGKDKGAVIERVRGWGVNPAGL
jgi:hypothetical protein